MNAQLRKKLSIPTNETLYPPLFQLERTDLRIATLQSHLYVSQGVKGLVHLDQADRPVVVGKGEARGGLQTMKNAFLYSI